MIIHKIKSRLLSIIIPFTLLMGLICNLYSCSNNNNIPKDIVSFDKMKLVLWDDTKAQVYAKEILSRDSLVNDTLWYRAMKEKILQHHHISKEQYEKSYRYYSMHPELFIRLTDSIQKMQVQSFKNVNPRKPVFLYD
jgi:hypothetical protein